MLMLGLDTCTVSTLAPPLASAKLRQRIVEAMAKESKSKRVQVLSSRVTFRGPVFYVTSDRIKEPSGVEARRDIVRHPGSVVIMALDESRREPRVLLARQYRYAADAELWEFPAGRIDAGEDELQAARRELVTRQGFFHALRTLTSYLVFPSWEALLSTMAFSRPPPLAP